MLFSEGVLMDSPVVVWLLSLDPVVAVVGVVFAGLVLRLVVGYLSELLARLAWFGRLPR